MRNTIRSLACAAPLVTLVSTAPAQSVHAWREVQLPGQPRRVAMDTLGRATRVPVTATAAWASLRAAFDQLQVRTDVHDSAAGALGSSHLIRSYEIGRIRMSQAFDCGSGPSGPLADQGRVHIAVMSFVSGAGADSSDVRTVAIAVAERIDGSSIALASCTSLGALENYLMDQVSPRRRR